MKSRWAGGLLVVVTVGISSVGSGGFNAATDVLGQWIPVGPSPIPGTLDVTSLFPNSGRVGSIAVDPANASHWLVGVSNGGLWETRNAGGSWVPLTDGAPTLAMGAVTFDPTNSATIYAGTGANGGGGIFKGGLGILKSTDGGVTWVVVGAQSFARGSVKRLRVNPANSSELAAASTRGGFGRQLEDFPPQPPPYGILTSTDAGATWTRTLAGQATALEIDPANFNHQYAAIGEQSDGQGAGVAVNGVYRSTDAGRNWQLIAGPWPVSSTAALATGPIELALAPSDPNRLYVSISQTSSQNPPLIGLWTTTNAWDDPPSFQPQSTAGTIAANYGGAGSYCISCQSHVITVSPSDPTVIFAGGTQSLWRRVFVGSVPQWTNLTPASSGVHPDQRAVAWAGSRLILGDDGGVWSTTDFGATWQNHNGSLSTAMFYSGALHPTNPNIILGGLRDFTPVVRSGTSSAWTLLKPASTSEWGEAEVAMSSTHPETDWMGGWVNGVIQRTTDGGKTIVEVDAGIDKTGAAFVAPVRKCPANDDVFVTGTRSLWRTNSFFNSTAPLWVPNGPSVANSTSSTIFTVDFMATDTNCGTYAYGTNKGELRLTRDGGNTWVDLDPNKQLPARAIQSIALDPTTGSTIYVALSSFNAATAAKPGHVYKTTNALSSSPTWVNAGPPEDVPFNVVRLDPRNSNLVYAGSDTGLWVSGDAGVTWQKIGPDRGLPNAAVYDVQINPVTNQTVVFTHGRSAFKLALTQ